MSDSSPNLYATQFALQILQCYRDQLEWTAPERTVYQCRDAFLKAYPERSLADFTIGLRVLLEQRFVKRLNDERLELTAAGRAWLTSQPAP